MWVTGRKIRWETIQIMLDAPYVDGYKALPREDPGYTFPTADPHLRLDYVFLPAPWMSRLRSCDVVRDHRRRRARPTTFRWLAELDVP